MKNLKRVLSFALATAMLVGMMVVGAGAAEFTDGNTIENADAVNTLVALNVINGKDDGSFDPTAVVTRAEMAKMITVALNGGKVPTLPTNAKPVYTDIGGHWAQAYIEYCAGLGIVSGRGDGTFDPNGTVTGTEAAKMMLVAMGYPSDVYGFTGANWAINVGIEANKAELFEGIEDVDTAAGLIRDNTAQLIYNGIMAPTMKKTPNQVVGGDITWVYSPDSSMYVGKFKGETLTGTFEGNDLNTSAKEGEISVAGKCFPAEFDIAYIGEEVDVLFKEGKESLGAGLDRNDVIYGVMLTGKTSVVTATKADINDNYEDDANHTNRKVEINEVEYKVATTADKIYTNYIDDNTAMAMNAYNIENTLAKANGDTIKFILNEDGEIVSAYVVTTTIDYVTAVNATKITLASAGTFKLEDHNVAEGLKKDDVVVITELYDTTNDDSLATIELAEKVSGTVEGYKTGENVVVDGTTYKLYNEAALIDLGFTTDDNTANNFNGKIGETYDLYLVNGFVGAAVQTSESADNYSLVIDVTGSRGSTFDPKKLYVMAADGTKTTLVVDEDCTAADSVVKGDIITYTGEADCADVTKETVVTTGAPFSYKENTKSLNGVTVASNATLFAETTTKNDIADPDAKVKTYTLRDLKNVNNITKYVVEDNKVVAAFADLNTTPNGASTSSEYGIVSANNGVVKIGDDEYTSYTIENDTASYTVYTDEDIIATGDLVKFNVTNDSIVEDDDVDVLTHNGTDIIAAYAKELNEGDNTLVFYTGVNESTKKGTGMKTYALDEDVVIVYVNADDDEAGEEIGINAFDAVEPKKNILVVTEDEGDDLVVTAIFVETSGECGIDE